MKTITTILILSLLYAVPAFAKKPKYFIVFDDVQETNEYWVVVPQEGIGLLLNRGQFVAEIVTKTEPNGIIKKNADFVQKKPFCWKTLAGMKKLVKMLQEVNALNLDEVLYAAIDGYADYSAIKYLLDIGADPNGKEGAMLLRTVFRELPKIVELLSKYGAVNDGTLEDFCNHHIVHQQDTIKAIKRSQNARWINNRLVFD